MLRNRHVSLFLQWVPGGIVLCFPEGEKPEPDEGLVTELQIHLGKADSS